MSQAIFHSPAHTLGQVTTIVIKIDNEHNIFNEFSYIAIPAALEQLWEVSLGALLHKCNFEFFPLLILLFFCLF